MRSFINRLKRPTEPLTPQVPATLTREQVVESYWGYLGRGPENDEVVASHIDLYRTPERFAAALTDSSEHRDRMAALVHHDRPSFTIEEIGEIASAFAAGDRTTHIGKVLRIPGWFDCRLNPDSPAYADQMMRLWKAITGRENYDPSVDEDTPEVVNHDFIYRPAFYNTGDAGLAGAHLMAIGHILVRSNLPGNGRVLEYGAGFGQTSFAFARTGAKVDVVDINKAFVDGVNEASAFFRTDLTSHLGLFGANPAGEPNAYDLILFYESFHHCWNAAELIERMKGLLKPGGCVILAGEPVSRVNMPDIPFPWGFRLDWENIAIMRLRGWMELGFQEAYLFHLFERAGFRAEFFPDPNAHWAQVYRFTLI